MGLLVLLAAGSASAGKFTVEMPLDTYIDAENASESYSEDETLWATSVEGEPLRMIYLNFNNNFGNVGVFSPDQIESAELKIYASDVEVPGEMAVYFSEGSIIDIDWDNKLEYETNESVSLEIDGEGEYSVDVTPLVKRAREACPEDCGYSLVLVAEGDASVGFASSESSEDEPELEFATAE
jgi:argininosuccinate synthase